MIKTVLIKVTNNRISKKDLDVCSDVLTRGGLILFPTDTVYGLACNAFHPASIKRIYALKGRSYKKPLPIFLGDDKHLPLVAADIIPESKKLMRAFWPGPLTLVFKTAPMAFHAVRGKSTIAVRVPDYGAVKQILNRVRVPLATTSANQSGRPSIKSGTDAIRQFRGLVDVIVDGGHCPLGQESTIIDVSHFPFNLIRQGALSKERIAKILNI